MGKSSKKYPEYTTGTVTINGRKVATASKDKDNNVVSSSYNMSDIEKSMYDSIQKNMNTSLNNFFNITDSQKDEWKKQLEALKKSGTDQINSIYTPMETELRNNIANRFGNLDNSAFMDNLNKILEKKSNSISQLGTQLALQQDSLYANELANRMNTLNFLNGLNTSMNNNIRSYLGLAASNSESGNNYNNAAYNNQKNSSSLFDSFLSPQNIASVGSSVLSFI